MIGIDTPLKLLRNVIYLLGMHLALRGGVEHNNLRRLNSQLSVQNDSRGVECLVYREDPLQKTNQGGLLSKGKSKVVWIYPVENNPERDPVFVYKKYLSLMPSGTSCSKLYLRPRKLPTPAIWYCDQAWGINKVRSAVREMCKEAGLLGKFTNHSLRATCASRMFDGHVPEQIIKETTGHRSNCMRYYKRTSSQLRQVASATLSKNVESDKNVKIDDMSDVFEAQNEVEFAKTSAKCDMKSMGKTGLTAIQMLRNVLKTRQELRKKMFPKSRLSLRKYKNHKVSIDVNVNVKK